MVVAFSERTGGVSAAPYATLDLASHVGDDPSAVDRNRSLLLAAFGLETLRPRLVTAEQVHGDRVALADEGSAGAGAWVDPRHADFRDPVAGTDALITSTPGLPVLMLYADCVPVVLVVAGPRPAVAVVHAGWKGALASLPGVAAERLARHAGVHVDELLAYIGPHIASCCYEVDERLLSHFCNIFDTIGAVDGRLDLAAAVRESLARAGVGPERIASVGACTRDRTDRFFSYRADPITGRHGALAVITEGE